MGRRARTRNLVSIHISFNNQTLTYGPSSEQLTGDWTSPIYAFFSPIPDITYDAMGCHAHEFHCTAAYCKGKQIICQFLDTMDHKSTSNLKRHATVCWGSDVVGDALEARDDLKSTRKMLSEMRDGSITASFQWKGKGKVSYSHRQHTKAETW